MPLKVNYDSDSNNDEVIFAVSTSNNLTPVGILKTDKPQALFFRMGESGRVDVLKEYLPALEKLEGVTVEQFKERAKNA